ncbi:unnamed protein product [Lampetra fluviatilis]
MVVGAGPSSSPGTGDGWRQVAEQIDSLRAVLLNLVTLVAPSAAPGRPHGTLLSGDGQGPLGGVSEGPLGQASAAIAASGRLSAIAATWQDDAILGGPASAPQEAAILAAPRGTRAAGPSGDSVALAMAAYPDAKPDMLDPLNLGKMLELSKELGILMPVCGHEPLTSRRRGDRRPDGRCGPLEEDRGAFGFSVGAALGHRWGRPAGWHDVLLVWPAGPLHTGLSESSPPAASSRIPTSAAATVVVL